MGLVLEESAYLRADINSYLCPKDLLTPFVAGTQFEDTFIETKLIIEPCDPETTTCQDEATIQAKVNMLTIETFFLNTNFDGTNIEQPLFNYMDFSIQAGLDYEA